MYLSRPLTIYFPQQWGWPYYHEQRHHGEDQWNHFAHCQPAVPAPYKYISNTVNWNYSPILDNTWLYCTNYINACDYFRPNPDQEAGWGHCSPCTKPWSPRGLFGRQHIEGIKKIRSNSPFPYAIWHKGGSLTVDHSVHRSRWLTGWRDRPVESVERPTERSDRSTRPPKDTSPQTQSATPNPGWSLPRAAATSQVRPVDDMA